LAAGGVVAADNPDPEQEAAGVAGWEDNH